MTYVSVDFKGRASKVDEETLADYQADVMESGGALLRFDGADVYEYTGREDDEAWQKVS